MEEIKKILIVLIPALILSGTIYITQYISLWISIPIYTSIVVYGVNGIANWVVYQNWAGKN